MTYAILITESLQNDFVGPLGRFDPLPNFLHVGHEEARRLMGDNPDEGPVAKVIEWAYGQDADKLAIIHIRDWHTGDDEADEEHIHRFKPHCLEGSRGAQFAFPIFDEQRHVDIVNSRSLNDFVDTNLAELLEPYRDQDVKLGLMGVTTDAKITFLAYEMHSRFPRMEIAVCPAITASSSRAQHYFALEQMKRFFGVTILPSIGEFIDFLSQEDADFTLPAPRVRDLPELTFETEHEVSEIDRGLISYLYRDCSKVVLFELSGGYSGNLVLAAESIDLNGHLQVPHVIKIGHNGPMGQERMVFEQIEAVLGNNAPRIVDFADFGDRGALKYRYTAMGGGFSTTFQKLYSSGLGPEKVEHYLRAVFQDQLGRLYRAGQKERINLLEYYGIDPDYAPRMREKVERVYGGPADGEILTLPTGQEFPNPCVFYERHLKELYPKAEKATYLSYIHGDLNGANIIIDDFENVWIIDFFSTHRGHVLRDFIKLENDLLYIYTPVKDLEEFREATRLTDVLLSVQDLSRVLPPVEQTGLTNPEMIRTYKTISLLRSMYEILIHEDRNTLQLLVGQLRYAGHTFSFFEADQWQKKWALYTTGRISHILSKRLRDRGPLRIELIDEQYINPGRLGITLLPGRKDYNRDIDEDLRTMRENGVTHVVTLIMGDEFAQYGVDDLLEHYKKGGFVVRHFPIMDQQIPTLHHVQELVNWMDRLIDQGHTILVHCVGGLGRAGLVSACYLVFKGLTPQAAIEEVRRVRSARAVETKVQEEFVYRFAKTLGAQ